MIPVPLDITAGLPFAKTFVATLPLGRDWWTNTSQFEVLSQVREEARRDSPLVIDFADYITVTMTGADTVTIELVMSGEDTRKVTKRGFYDLIISDVGVSDARGYVLSKGPVRLNGVITAEARDMA